MNLVGCDILPHISCTTSLASTVTFTSAEKTEDLHNGLRDMFLNVWPNQCDKVNNYIDPESLFAKHLMTSNYTVKASSGFKSLLRSTDRKILIFSEAMLIRLHTPALCTLVLLIQTLRLPRG